MIELPAEFRADLETFRGPLDLLLYLIKKEEIEIVDIPIARITNQYLSFLEILKQIDPNACGEFLVMSANLMEIKSKMLLPELPLEEGEEQELEDPRLELVLQLLEYKKYKERALVLERMVHDHALRFERPEEDVPELERETLPLSLGSVSIWDLLTAFQRVQMALELRQPHRVLYEDRPIEEYIAAIEGRLDEVGEGHLPFESLFEPCEDRYELIGFFLAVLELAKRGRILFEQPGIFGDIRISRRLEPPEEIQEEEEMSAASLEAGSRLDTLEARMMIGAGIPGDGDAVAGGVAGTDSPEESTSERAVSLRLSEDDLDEDEQDFDDDDSDEDDEDFDDEDFDDEDFMNDEDLDEDFDDDDIEDLDDDEDLDDEDEIEED